MKPFLQAQYLISFLLFALGHSTDREMRQLLNACFGGDAMLRVQVSHDDIYPSTSFADRFANVFSLSERPASF